MNSVYVPWDIVPQKISVAMQDVMTANAASARFACVALCKLKDVACWDPEMFSSYYASYDPFFCLVAKSYLRLLFTPIYFYFYLFSVFLVGHLNVFGVS